MLHPEFRIYVTPLLFVCSVLAGNCDPILAQRPPAQPVRSYELAPYQIVGPYAHANLAVFLIHGSDQSDDRNVVTLPEALAQKIVVVHETGSVGELQIENTSKRFAVFIHAGDMVKGGKQDRTISNDYILPAKSGRVPVESFCVESGRWEQRAGESVERFESSEKILSSRDLKIASRAKKDQNAVWSEVAATQQKLGAILETEVRHSKSDTSLQLSLENKKLQEKLAAYTKALSPAPAGKSNTIGYAFFINGKLNSVEIYSSNRLFGKLWPRLLESSATEAIAHLERDARERPQSAHYQADFKEIESALQPQTDDEGRTRETELSRRVRLRSAENDRRFFFETTDRESGAFKHRTYIMK